MNSYDVYHMTRIQGAKGIYRKLSAVIEAEDVFAALEIHRKQCEAQNLETAGGLVTHRIVAGVGQPIGKARAT
jgi:hypothetical protein